MKNKKQISIVVLLILILNMFTYLMPVYGENTDNNSDKIISFLNAFEIVGENEINRDKAITRGEFAIYAARIIGDKFYTNSSEQYYYDVTKADDCFISVSRLVSQGALSVGEDRLFKPDEAITYSEICKILVCILGYGVLAEQKGGYPQGYLKQAWDIGISKNISENFTSDDIYRMLYNACHANVFGLDDIDENKSANFGISDKTALEFYRDVYCAKGIITKNEYTSLTDFTNAGKGTVHMGSLILNVGETDIFKQIGNHVELYYQDDSDENTVVYYYSDTETVTIKAKDIDEFSDNKLTYYTENGEKIKKVSVHKEVPFIMNGKVLTENKANELNNLKYGYIVLSFYSDQCIAISIMKEETYVVQTVDRDNAVIYDRNQKTETIDCGDDTEYLKIYDVETLNTLTVDMIERGSVITAYRSEDRKYVELFVRKHTISGTVTAISEDNGITKISIDNVDYDMNAEIRDKGYISIAFGNAGQFKLNVNNEICDYIPIVSQNTFGYLYKAVIDEYNEDTVIVKIFASDNTFKTFNVTKNVKIDGKKYKTPDAVMNTLYESGDMGTVRQLIRYQLNDSGELRKIDTAAPSQKRAEENGSLVAMVSYTGQTTPFYWAQTITASSFYPEPVIDRDTQIFIVPDEGENTSDPRSFLATDYSWFSRNLPEAKMSAYKIDFSYPAADAIVLRENKSAALSDRDKPFMVDEITQELTEDDEVRYFIYGYQGGIGVKYPIDDSYYENMPEIDRGDLMRVATNSVGEVCDAEVLLDYSKNKDGKHRPNWYNPDNTVAGREAQGESTHVTATTCYTFGHVIEKWYDNDFAANVTRPNSIGLILRIGYNDTTTVNRTVNCANVRIVVYDTQRNKVYSGTEEDIYDYKTTARGSEMVLISSSYYPTALYIYKN